MLSLGFSNCFLVGCAHSEKSVGLNRIELNPPNNVPVPTFPITPRLQKDFALIFAPRPFRTLLCSSSANLCLEQ